MHLCFCSTHVSIFVRLFVRAGVRMSCVCVFVRVLSLWWAYPHSHQTVTQQLERVGQTRISAWRYHIYVRAHTRIFVHVCNYIYIHFRYIHPFWHAERTTLWTLVQVKKYSCLYVRLIWDLWLGPLPRSYGMGEGGDWWIWPRGLIAKGIPRVCQCVLNPVSWGYPLSIFNQNSTLKQVDTQTLPSHESSRVCFGPRTTSAVVYH